LRMRLRDKLRSFRSPMARRDWLARERQIKGLGYKESSHFLRSIGYHGYGILDKHILYCLQQLGVIELAKSPVTRNHYIEIEDRMKRFADEIEINFDELDLVLWSMRAGEILK
ncbi:MAG: N-glycosylase/DNA lyase, partial [Pyrinomonadaceae bacterium]